jgi:hypothetical protein
MSTMVHCVTCLVKQQPPFNKPIWFLTMVQSFDKRMSGGESPETLPRYAAKEGFPAGGILVQWVSGSFEYNVNDYHRNQGCTEWQ